MLREGREGTLDDLPFEAIEFAGAEIWDKVNVALLQHVRLLMPSELA